MLYANYYHYAIDETNRHDSHQRVVLYDICDDALDCERSHAVVTIELDDDDA